jgi:malic enzyme
MPSPSANEATVDARLSDGMRIANVSNTPLSVTRAQMSESTPTSPLVPPTAIHTTQRGAWILRHAATNKGLAFSAAERELLGLDGLLPTRIETLEEQVAREMEHLRAKPNELEKYIGLVTLQDRNRVLFYRVLIEHMSELMPLIYTPTVGIACQQYSHIFRGPRGIWLTPDDVDHIPDRLRNTPNRDVRLIVVTDNERILGLGDQGAGGMGIPVGKLTLYVAAGGIHPSKVLPISLDLGTNNPRLLADPLYLGYRQRRIVGRDYERFLENFVEAVRERFPNALLQWEDFHKSHAFDLLEGYRRRLPSFNDDIQGTSAVVLAGIYAYLKREQRQVAQLRAVFLGAGEACTGSVRLLQAAMRRAGVDEDTIAKSVLVFDHAGIVHDGRHMDPHKREVATTLAWLEKLGLSPEATPVEAIGAFKPSVLVGATASPGAFTQAIIEEMSKHCDVPLVMPLSNPTSKAECAPKEAIAWSGGRALVATGSPFEAVEHGGRTQLIGQANNLFIFPGVGLGAILSELSELPDEVFCLAAETLAECVSDDRLKQGALYPSIEELRNVSARIASRIVRYGSEEHLGRRIAPQHIDSFVRQAMWYPEYVPVIASDPTSGLENSTDEHELL